MFINRIKYLLFIFIVWTTLIVYLISSEYRRIDKEVDNLSITNARANFNKDQAIRHWAALHGGVYVPVDSTTLPNPALENISERDIITPSGKKLTLMNPAYMIRELNEYFASYYGIVGHITSTKLLRPENKPDEWELNALNQFENGAEEVIQHTTINDKPYLRLMKPMLTEESCLNCHEHQGYKVGDIRGGVSVSIPMEPLLLQASKNKKQHRHIFTLIWIIGSSGLFFGYKKIDSGILKLEKADKALREHNIELGNTKNVLEKQNKNFARINAELIKTEAKNRLINEELLTKSEELKITNSKLLFAKEKAEESNRLKTEFINNISHEIRTPMNGIMGFTQFLERPQLSEEKRKYYASIIKNSGNQLLRVIDDILMVSDLGKRKAQIYNEKIDLGELLTEVYEVFEMKARSRNVPLYLKLNGDNEKITFVTDKSKVNTVLHNLLENAFKFTTEGYVELGYFLDSSNEHNNVIIYVKDTGVGISPENQKEIFNRFSQEEKEMSQKSGGLGLGLAIAKESAHLIEGEITLQSEKGKGSTFFLTLPYTQTLKEKKLPAASITFKENDQKKSSTILVAEDTETSYLFIKAFIEDLLGERCYVIHAKNGKEAVEICKKNPNVGFVFMDLKMPIMDGFEATQIIKGFRPNLAIVAQTAFISDKVKSKALSAGCDDFIKKPLNGETLKYVINNFLLN